MNRLAHGLAMLCGVAAASAAVAQERLPLVVNWSEWRDQGRLKAGEVLAGEEGQPERLRIEKTTEGEELIPLLDIEQPNVQGRSYLLKGRVKYSLVAAGTGTSDAGYLEMWNHFPDGGAYFTRTLGASGPMAKFVGTSDWRDVALPFDKADAPSPAKLVVNLHLPGPGTVELGPLELIDDVSFGPTRAAGAWWDERMAGFIGGVGGSLVGLIGGAIGIAVGVFRQRALGNALSVTILVVGVMALTVGVAALSQAQPYAVYYPLLLLGGICTICSIACLVIIRVGYQQAELRRMQALDVK
jgi:hypothetical protein